jgi:Secretion system C-terminal sorting domain
MFFKIITMVLILTPLLCFSQKQGNIWCFGDSAGVDWNDLENPTFFQSSSSYRGSCASIADTNGTLLFYCANVKSDGLICSNFQFNFIYNKNHEVMQNGDCLTGLGWYTQHTIFSAPNSDSLYYVFSTDGISYLAYSIVDMSANEGLGAVIERDHQLVGYDEYGQFAWSLAAVKHGNGKDWWVIAKSGGSAVQLGLVPHEYYIFLVNDEGVTTTVRSAENNSSQTNVFQLLFNQQGDKFYSIGLFGLLEEYNFNRCTGDLTLNRTIDDTAYYSNGDSVYTRAYFCSEISPNGRFLYTSTLVYDCIYWKSYLLQIDLWTENPIEHIDTLSITSPLINGEDDYRGEGALRLAPDGKIYFSTGLKSCIDDVLPYPDSVYTISNSYLGVINSPDSLGEASNYQEYSFYLGGNRTYIGLPNNPNYNLEPLNCDSITSLPKEQKSFLKTNFNIFPNPCYNNCTLEYKPALSIGNIAISNMQGKIVFTEQNIPVTLLQNGYEVNTSAFAKGVYTVTLVTGSEVVTKRLVKM